MRIGVDATSWTNRRGFGRFTRNAVARLVALDATATYVLLLDEASAAAPDLPRTAERVVVRLHRPAAEAASAESRRSVGDLVRLARAARRARVDAFLFPSMLTYFPVPGVATVVGLHDTIAEEHPHLTFPSRRSRVLWQLKQRLATRGSDRIFTVSTASREALAHRLRVAPDHLAVVPEAPDPVFRRRSPAEVEQVREELGIGRRRDIVLYAGGISPHKNIETLLEAFTVVLARRKKPPVLVLVGDLEGETYVSAAAGVRSRIEDLGIGLHVLLPGFVSDEALARLYTAAAVVALPSLAEGFGLPAVEAAACGAPVVLSDLPAHRESLGPGALYFPPRDVEVLAAHLEHLLEDPRARASLAAKGQVVVATLTWDAAAERLRTLLHEAAGS